MARGELSVDDIEENIKKLLSSSPVIKRQQLSIRTGILSDGGMLSSDNIISSGHEERIIKTIEQLSNRCESGRNCCERVMICYWLAKVNLDRFHDIISISI